MKAKRNREENQMNLREETLFFTSKTIFKAFFF